MTQPISDTKATGKGARKAAQKDTRKAAQKGTRGPGAVEDTVVVVRLGAITLQKRNRPVTGEAVRAFYHREMEGTTPDLDEMRRTRERFGRINFGEIAGHWEAERLEMLEA